MPLIQAVLNRKRSQLRPPNSVAATRNPRGATLTSSPIKDEDEKSRLYCFGINHYEAYFVIPMTSLNCEPFAGLHKISMECDKLSSQHVKYLERRHPGT